MNSQPYSIQPAAQIAAPERVIICMKWGTKYGPEYVNRLYAMVRKQLSGSFKFVCLTDSAEGIRAEVLCRPIPSLDLPAGSPERGWTKLTTFSADLAELIGAAQGSPTLFLDIDVVIVGAMDEFFSTPGEFVIIHDYKRPWRITGNSSVYRFALGAHPDVLDYFRGNFDQIRQEFRNEQAYLSDFIHRQGKLQYWPAAWCPSFKYHSIPRWPTNYWREPFVPEGARVIIFHGECNPPDALAGKRNRRFRFIQPTRYVAQYWRE
jgi:hypothetical protein